MKKPRSGASGGFPHPLQRTGSEERLGTSLCQWHFPQATAFAIFIIHGAQPFDLSTLKRLLTIFTNVAAGLAREQLMQNGYLVLIGSTLGLNNGLHNNNRTPHNGSYT